LISSASFIRFEGYDRGLYDDEGGIPNVDATRVRSASTARAVKSKMAQLTESMRPKCFGSSMEPTRNSQDVLQKHVSTGKAKRNSEEPQFPNGTQRTLCCCSLCDSLTLNGCKLDSIPFNLYYNGCIIYYD